MFINLVHLWALGEPSRDDRIIRIGWFVPVSVAVQGRNNFIQMSSNLPHVVAKVFKDRRANPC